MATLIGGNAADLLDGAPGAVDDLLVGQHGADTLRGGLGLDTLVGGAGHDLIDGGRGADLLSGGSGNDTFFYADRLDMAGDRISDFAAGDLLDFSRFADLGWRGDSGFSGAGRELRYRSTTLDSQPAIEILFDLDGDTAADGSIFLMGALRLEQVLPGFLALAAPQRLTGTDAADTLTGGVAADLLRGGAGNDLLVGGDGNDRLLGGAGLDTLVGGGGADTLTGGGGADLFEVSSLADSADRITDFTALDQLSLVGMDGAGGFLTFIADADFSGTAGEIRFAAGLLQIDTDGDALGDRSIAIDNVDLLEATSAGSLLFRLAESKLILAGPGAATLQGGGGVDTLAGAGGDDSLLGHAGADSLSGEAGADTLVGGSGADTLRGGDGNDLLVGQGGADVLTGGAGTDTFRILDAADIGATALARFGGTLSTLQFDTITDFTPGDRIDLGALGPLSLIGAAPFSETPGEVQLLGTSLRIDLDGDGFGELGLSLPGFVGELRLLPGGILDALRPNNVTGGAGADSLVGDAVADTLRGAEGADTLSGLGGPDLLEGDADRDLLLGGDGADTLRGGDAPDTLIGGAGDDVLVGGVGADRFVVSALEDLSFVDDGLPFLFGRVFDRILDFQARDFLVLSGLPGLTFIGEAAFSGVAMQARVESNARGHGDRRLTIDVNGDGVLTSTTDRMLSFATTSLQLEEAAPGSGQLRVALPVSLIGTAGGETLSGGGANDTLQGAGGDDLLRGGAGGSDRMLGGDGADTLRGEGNAGADTLDGGAGDDVVIVDYGGALVVLTGGGDDRLVLGADWFATRGASSPGQVTVQGFGIGDTFDISALPGGSFIGGAAFSGVAGQVRMETGRPNASSPAGSTIVMFDTDGDALADRSFVLSNSTLVAEDFVLVAPGRLGIQGPLNLTGGNGADSLTGGSFNDTLVGGAGADTLNGVSGDDRLSGGSSDDVLIGGFGADTLMGGAGSDVFVFGPDSTGVRARRDVITDFQLGTGALAGDFDVIDLSAIDADRRTDNGDQAFRLVAGPFTGTRQAQFSDGVLSLNIFGAGVAEMEIALVGVTSLNSWNLIL